jgi:DNA-directed RNA polymerase subunit RPC12/RpoP
MAKNTVRDLVWCELVARRDNSEAFTKQDIAAAVESSARTVHDVLQTAVEHGLLVKEGERQKVDDPRGDRATQWQEVNVYRVAENHEPSDMATQDPVNGKNSDSTPTPEADKLHSGSNELEQTDMDVSPTDEPDISESHADMHEARYVIECPDCRRSMTREQNSSLVKGVRAKRRACGDCGTILELAKDNRPNPPQCPECDQKVLHVSERAEFTTYVHDVQIVSTGGVKMRVIDDKCHGK